MATKLDLRKCCQRREGQCTWTAAGMPLQQKAVQRRDWVTTAQADWHLIGQHWPVWPPSSHPVVAAHAAAARAGYVQLQLVQAMCSYSSYRLCSSLWSTPCAQSAPATFKVGPALRTLALECGHIKGLCSVVFMLIACKEGEGQ